MAAMGTPSAAASMSTRLSDSGPYDGNASSGRAASRPSTSARSIHPSTRRSMPAPACVRFELAAQRAVAGDDERHAHVRAGDRVEEELHALVRRELAGVEHVRLDRGRRRRVVHVVEAVMSTGLGIV